ncbi:MAG: hypothetical protein COW24_00380 [Candidatus Kerfeldbacteria bacterium CG15_BIG_FIL_POST_REV_8_21_14_020_45_12]|uniref:Regulator of chromosome condensation n=1 Tax=Candidatus Kerfeldbacteria bacterium CG15_BIG_FIL_POST_REV_8_21_14_020_45_12 TaxID=2014247 RepID=A0A2M7H591_9BACT|nr:MAG: hypothetical protein COW24_00380 [Candidatus Kerfeldbacteria bacterium CG15_BIG_FIL_POST_REV_8_21_14_020_45_12]PJA92799.1 MAG: hypothetical protein CO132_06020 [Candidatus Kerfeldbacteria bacterium CG_4_9_14_3_um_filter_45_8]
MRCIILSGLVSALVGCNPINDTSWYPVDRDGDGYDQYSDCDDADYSVHPGALERQDGKDNNCDGAVDGTVAECQTWYYDWDGDGFGVQINPGDSRYEEFTRVSCESPGASWVASGTDCDDAEAATYPGATEICDGQDNDCNGSQDDDANNAVTYYVDVDRDGYGEDILGINCTQCDWPGNGWSTNSDDVAPTNPDSH